jgi:hypothetical protein
MKKFAVDIALRQFHKKGEDICGDAAKVVQTPNSTVIVVSDGLGSGVKANVLATLTVELASGLFGGDLSLREIVETMIATLPVCKWRNLAYSTFSIVRIYDTGQVTVAERDTPGIIRIKNGTRPERIVGTESQICEKTIGESHFRMSPGDMLVLYSDGIVYAGVGEGLPMGWQEEGIFEFVSQVAPVVRGDCDQLSEMIIDRALDYWAGRPGDDGTVLCAKYRRARHATILTGPPAERTLVPRMLKDFLSRKGVKIVSGGTTAHLVADHLQKELEIDPTLMDSDLPPAGALQGVDLVTEGILTLSRATEYLKRGVPTDKQDAAVILLSKVMDADGITIIVGTARNPAHQNTGLPESIFLRRTVVEELASQLRGRGKEVELVYY